MTKFLKLMLILVALIIGASFFSEKPSRALQAIESDKQPQMIMALKAGSRFITIYGKPEKGAYAFQPYIEHDDDIFLTVMRALIEKQTGARVAPTMYSTNDTPAWIIIGEPEHQFRVMIFKNKSDGEVYGVYLQPN